jgi:hypothetical protein
VTTIAYRDGVLAADTLITSGGERVGHHQKARRRGRLLYATTGSCGLGDAWAAWLRAGAAGEPPTLLSDGGTANGYVFLPDDAVVWFHSEGVTHIRAPFWAAGSGDCFARGAMETGATAEQAVAAAIKWDTGSGGEITVISVR